METTLSYSTHLNVPCSVFTHVAIHLFGRPSVRLSVYLSACLFVCLPVYLSVCDNGLGREKTKLYA